VTGGTGFGQRPSASPAPTHARARAGRRRPIPDAWEHTDLGHLGPEVGAALAALAVEATYEPGEVILREGAPAPFLGLVLAGRVGLRLFVPERGPQTVVTIEPGELVGWSAIVAPFRASAAAVALEPTRLQVFPAEPVRDLLAADPAVAAALLPVVLANVSEPLTTSSQQLLDQFAARGVEPW